MNVVHTDRFVHELSPSEAMDWFRDSQFDHIPPYFLTHWKTGKRFFYTHKGILAFEETQNEYVVAGEPLSPYGKEESLEVLEIFDQMARRKKKGVCGYYVSDNWQVSDFSKVCLGTSSKINLEDFNIHLPEAREVRRSLRKGEELGYTVVPLHQSEKRAQVQVNDLHQRWRRSRMLVDIRFLLSAPRPQHLASDYEEWFAVEKDGECLAFCSLLPYLKDGDLCFYLDNIIHDPQRDPQALSFLLSFLIQALKAEGVYELNLGLSPFAKTSMRGKVLIERFFSLLYQLPVVYKAKGLHFFKNKFGGVEEKEYCFFNQRESKWFQLAEMVGVTLLPKK